jgi:hypothetical protein
MSNTIEIVVPSIETEIVAPLIETEIVEPSIETPNEVESLTSLMSRINILSLEVETLTNRNTHLNNLLNVPNNEVHLDKELLAQIPSPGICVKEIALKAENKAMDYVFPDCRKKPYCFRTYRSLYSFVMNPANDNINSLIQSFWSELDDSVKSDIKDRIDFIKTEFMYFKTYIQDLKDLTEDIHAPSIDELKIMIQSSDIEMKDEIIEAIDECVKFNEIQFILTSPPLLFENCEVSAKDLAIKAEIKAMDFIFPDCRKKPFCFRSLGNLVAFVSNPTDEYTSHIAPEQWNDMSESVKQDIRNKIEYVSNKCEYLKTHINDLKYGGKITTKVHPNIESLTNDFVNRGEGELLESIEECLTFLEQKLTSNRVINKSKSSIRLFGEDKPIITVMNENQNISSINNVTENNNFKFLKGFSRGF